MDQVSSFLDNLYNLKSGIVEPSSEVVPFIEPVSVSQWISDEYYCGSIAKDLYLFWRDVIVEFEETRKNELIITGSLSSGKSFCSLALMLRKLYVLSCYRPLPVYLGLADTSEVVFIYLAISVQQAIRTGFGKLLRMVDSTPYFREQYQRDKRISSAINFTSKELAVIAGSDTSHYRGSDMFGMIFDEGNFRTGSDKTKLDKAMDIYVESTNRRKTRFINSDEDKSFSIVVSSVDGISSFTENRIQSADTDSSVMVVRANTWQTKPRRFSGTTFWVYKGSDKIDPFLESDITALASYFNVIGKNPIAVKDMPFALKMDWVEVPTEYENQFRTSIVRALADIAGIAVGSTSRIMTDEVAYKDCFHSTDKVHPFTKERIVLSYQTAGRVEDYLLSEFKFNPNLTYFAHIDQSLSHDSTGLAISHKDKDEEGILIVTDLMLKIDPPQRPDQISVRKVREFLFYLKDHRYCRFGLCTMDQYASAESLQELENGGIPSARLSVDKDAAQYDLLVDLILRRRLRGYPYLSLKEELFFLEKDKYKQKVDHVKHMAKDLSDGLAGSVWNAMIHGKISFDWDKFLG